MHLLGALRPAVARRPSCTLAIFETGGTAIGAQDHLDRHHLVEDRDTFMKRVMHLVLGSPSCWSSGTAMSA